MGLNYRKSINLGCGFRINISKSGVGYSWGMRGYRITKTAKGSIRRTASIRGTGISYTTNSKVKNRQTPSIQQENKSVNNYYDTENITIKSTQISLDKNYDNDSVSIFYTKSSSAYLEIIRYLK